MADKSLAPENPEIQFKKAKTGAERARAYRQRKRQGTPVAHPKSAKSMMREDFSSADAVSLETSSCAALPAVTSRGVARHGDSPLRHVSSILLQGSALALAGTGIAMNGWFARSLGSSDAAGWLFLTTGVATDLVALVVPSSAARLWQTGRRATSLAGWAVWAMTFVFAVMAGIGFASTNIADVTLARTSRTTPAIQTAQAALIDAMAARDRECKGGIGRFCREREAVVNERHQSLDAVMQSVGQAADPQTDAASRIVIWASHGMVKPSRDDFAMLRLVLLALLPQIGGILLLVAEIKPAQPVP